MRPFSFQQMVAEVRRAIRGAAAVFWFFRLPYMQRKKINRVSRV